MSRNIFDSFICYPYCRLLKLDQSRIVTRKSEDRERKDHNNEDPDYRVLSNKGLKSVTIKV